MSSVLRCVLPLRCGQHVRSKLNVLSAPVSRHASEHSVRSAPACQVVRYLQRSTPAILNPGRKCVTSAPPQLAFSSLRSQLLLTRNYSTYTPGQLQRPTLNALPQSCGHDGVRISCRGIKTQKRSVRKPSKVCLNGLFNSSEVRMLRDSVAQISFWLAMHVFLEKVQVEDTKGSIKAIQTAWWWWTKVLALRPSTQFM